MVGSAKRDVSTAGQTSEEWGGVPSSSLSLTLSLSLFFPAVSLRAAMHYLNAVTAYIEVTWPNNETVYRQKSVNLISNGNGNGSKNVR